LCKIGWITASGAPFCYPLPAGFTDFSSIGNYGQGWTYRTLVSLGQHDLIEVLAYRVNFDADALTTAKLTAIYDGGPELAPGRFTIVHASKPQSSVVSGGRAFRQVGLYSSGVSIDMTTVYRGHTWLTISCQSLTDGAAVARACAAVRDQIRIIGLA